MTVYDFLEFCNDLSGVTLTIYDFSTEGQVFFGDGDTGLSDIDDYILYHDVESFDIFTGQYGEICLELNICMEEESE